VVFENLWLREWTAHAIYINAAHGFSIKQCKIDSPRQGTPVARIRSVHAVFSSGPYAKGDFLAENNDVRLGGYQDSFPHDEQIIGLFFSNHDDITITGNTVSGNDEGIEVLGNKSDLSFIDLFSHFPEPANTPSEIVIRDNIVDVTQILDDSVWPGKIGIIVCGNENTPSVLIENNDVTIKGTDRGYGFALSGENLHVKNNSLHLEMHEDIKPGGAFLIGFGFMISPITPEMNWGPSLVNSVIQDNEFFGKAKGPSVYFFDPSVEHDELEQLFPGDVPNLSHGNQIEMNNIVDLGADITIAITPGAYDNTFTGDTGTILDLSPADSNYY